MKPIHILLVEDNEGDIVLTKDALEEYKIATNTSIARDGKAAIELLEELWHKGSAFLPDLILLDINLPKKNGQEVLQTIKSDNRFKEIPVIMLTTSSSEDDILRAYQNHANCFITKPVEAEQFLEVVSSIENFWISIVKLPVHK
ncbi:MAG: response regulator [Chitinophagaceae bacterium]|nr:response regulator [Bacteroidota bacterium]TAJ52401.1 MAG: response regulator [Chitinophagaceae bacterium]